MSRHAARTITREQLAKIEGVRFQYTRGYHRLDIREASIVADGKVVATDRHDGETGDIHRSNVYRFKLPEDITAELFTTTFCSFLREFSPLSRHRVPERSDGPDYFWHVG